MNNSIPPASDDAPLADSAGVDITVSDFTCTDATVTGDSTVTSDSTVTDDAVAVRIGDFLTPECVAVDLEVGSRKRLFEELARMVAAEFSAPALDDILATLIKREKLGCTGVGHGIALPHGRLDGLDAPVIAAAKLKDAIDYDAPDGEAVWLAVGLLVPVEATTAHLNILAALAGGFSQPAFCARLRACNTAAELAARLGDIEVQS